MHGTEKAVTMSPNTSEENGCDGENPEGGLTWRGPNVLCEQLTLTLLGDPEHTAQSRSGEFLRDKS